MGWLGQPCRSAIQVADHQGLLFRRAERPQVQLTRPRESRAAEAQS